MSGIFKDYNYRKGRYETFPYNDRDIKSVYHYREIDTYRLMHLRKGGCQGGIDIFMSHDWPQWIWEYGRNRGQDLIRVKPYFRDEMESGKLGSAPLKCILDHVQPVLWFAAHLHVKFAAVYPHQQSSTSNSTSDDRKNESSTPHVTRFLSLDKLLPGRDFLQIIEVDIPSSSSSSSLCNDELTTTTTTTTNTTTTNTTTTTNELEYDIEWLTIMRKTISLQSADPNPNPPPLPFHAIQPCSAQEMDDVRAIILNANQGTLKIQRNRNSTQFLTHNLLSSSSSSSVPLVDNNAIDIDDI